MKIHNLTCEFYVKFYLKNRYRAHRFASVGLYFFFLQNIALLLRLQNKCTIKY